MSELITCTALMAFSRHVARHGIIHGDPDNQKAKKVYIPARAVQNFVDDGLVRAPKGFEPTVETIDLPGAPIASDEPPAAADADDSPPV